MLTLGICNINCSLVTISIHWSTHGLDSMVPGGCRDICNIEICMGFFFDLVRHKSFLKFKHDSIIAITSQEIIGTFF